MLTVVASFVEPLTECLPLGAMMTATLYHFFDINPIMFFCSHLAIWLVIDYIQLRNVQVRWVCRMISALKAGLSCVTDYFT